MSFREMYNVIGIYFENKLSVFVLSMILGIIIWEVPNLFVYGWIYTVPVLSMAAFNINILIILSWSVLIGIPLLIYNKILKLN
jgi:hypothetical protein